MTQALFKLATKENHTYETEGVYYDYKVCEDDEQLEGWLTNFADLKDLSNGVQTEETKEQKTDEKVVAKRGRPAKNVMD